MIFHTKALRCFFYCLLFVAFPSFAASVNLAWDAPADTTDIIGYRVAYGTVSGSYSQLFDAGSSLTATISGLSEGTTYYFAAFDYAADGRTSAYSNEVSATTPVGAPVAGFSVNPSSGIAPLSVTFISASSGNITSYAWNFGDGGSATTQNATHIYTSPGSFGATLTVAGPGGSDTSSPSTVVVSASGGNETVFTSQTPALFHNIDGASYELGMRFKSTTAGQITALKFWKDSFETGTHTGRLWNASGQQLALVTFTGETASGWQTQNLATPYPIVADTEYMVTVNTGAMYYVATNNGLDTAITNAHLASIVGSNGRFGPVGQYPTNTWQGSNYFRDVVFIADSAPPPDTAPPSVPSNFVATTSGTSTINLSWGTSTDNVGVSGYRLERCQGSSGCVAFAQIASPTNTSFGDAGLASGTSYSYRVRATDAAGNLSGYSNVSTAITDSPPPPPTDTTPPMVTISSPADGAILNGKNVTINASATDNVGVVSMSLAIDGVTKKSVTTSTLSYVWNIKNVRGQHSIAVTATDAAGNQATKTITVTR